MRCVFFLHAAFSGAGPSFRRDFLFFYKTGMPVPETRNLEKTAKRRNDKRGEWKNTKKMTKEACVGKDDVFRFGRTKCGRCCRYKDDVTMTPLDVYNAAKHLDAHVDVIESRHDVWRMAHKD